MLVVVVAGGSLFIPGVFVSFVLSTTRWADQARRVLWPLSAVGAMLLAVSVPFVSEDPVPLRLLQGFGLGVLAVVLPAASKLIRELKEVGSQAG